MLTGTLDFLAPRILHRAASSRRQDATRSTIVAGTIMERQRARWTRRRKHQQPDPHANALLGAEINQLETRRLEKFELCLRGQEMLHAPEVPADGPSL
jgi:hypothetical protein